MRKGNVLLVLAAGIALVAVLAFAGMVLFRQAPPPSPPGPAGPRTPAAATLAPSPAAAAAVIKIEAESGAATPPFEVVKDQDPAVVSGGALARAASRCNGILHRHIERRPDGTVQPYEGDYRDRAKGSLSFTFEAPADGTYTVWLRARFCCSCGDSVWVWFDDETTPEAVREAAAREETERLPAVITNSTHRKFRGEDPFLWVSNARFKVPLAKGQCRLTILNREDGAEIDKVIVTSDLSEDFRPAGLEP